MVGLHSVHTGESAKLHEVLEDVVKGVGDVTKGVFHFHKHGEHEVEEHKNSSLAFFHRTWGSFTENSPQLKEAVRHTSAEISQWMHEGGPWRAFLVTTVGSVLLLGAAGLSAFMLFFLIATVNAVVLAFLGSIASVGAFAMAFFVSLIFIYSGAILVAAMSISTVTSLCICGALAVAGWIGIFWFILQGLKMTVEKLRGLCCFSVPPLTTVECRVAPTLTVESKVSEIECTRVCQTSKNNI